MKNSPRLKSSLLCLAAVLATCGVVAGLISCSSAPPAFLVNGPGVTGDDPPTLTIIEPVQNITRGQGDRFVIRWVDSDRDSNAQISFQLVNSATNETITLVEGIDENDTTGPDSFSVSTILVSRGTYYIRGTIDDGVNSPVSVFALVEGAASTDRVLVTITDPGAAPPTVPPVVTVTEPAFNLSVAQDDILRVSVQPTEDQPNQADPFDPDSDVNLWILLDTDLDPNNDDPANPTVDASGRPEDIIVLRNQTIAAEAFDEIGFEIQIDLATIPPRPAGDPYYVRATVDDLNNPRVHQYAAGTISVVELAAGKVDLADIGKTKSGARIYGFTPGANLGSSISGVSDFDADGVADFMLVAQKGNPRNLGRVGLAYLLYGLDQRRFGGAIAANQTSEDVAGVIFEAPPVRSNAEIIPAPDARTDGITDVGFIRDVSGDGRPELIFGLSHVNGAFEAMDFDPGDDEFQAGVGQETERTVTIRQGRVTVQESGSTDIEVLDIVYNGCEDLTINSATPTIPNGSGDLSWVDNGPDNSQWTLIKFKDVLDILPDLPSQIEIPSVRAQLQVNVVITGNEGRVFQSLSDFNEQTTYSGANGYAQNGGDPEPGVDYVSDRGNPLGTLDAASVGEVPVTVTDVVQLLLNRRLAESDNELRFLIAAPVSDTTDDEPTVISSSESNFTSTRPTLTITYVPEQANISVGCYPDDYVNNETTVDPDPDLQWYGGGVAFVVNSQNRDNDNVFGVMTEENPRGIDPNRLDETVIALELVGQEVGRDLDRNGLQPNGGEIIVRADNTNAANRGGESSEQGRISGYRFCAGWYDFVDHAQLIQPPREGLWGRSVSSMGDLNNDGLDEFIISAPRNEEYLADLLEVYGLQSTHWHSTAFRGSITVIPGANYNLLRDESGRSGNSSIPILQHAGSAASCPRQVPRPAPSIPADSFDVFAEDLEDMLGDGQSAGDVNQDGLDDILCGAPLNDRSRFTEGLDTGAAYILYGTNAASDYDLKNADDPLLRTPMLRIRGEEAGDQIGWTQATGLDVNGDRIDDVFIASPYADFGGVSRPSCGSDFDGDGDFDAFDLDRSLFQQCRSATGDYVFSDDPCIAFDYDYDRDIDLDDDAVFECLQEGRAGCCDGLVNNGFVAVIFGGVFLDGDRDISQVATSDLSGTVFFGNGAGDLAGWDVSSAGDFNQDGFGDILIAVPGEILEDSSGRERLGVVYLVFGGTHLVNTTWNLSQVGTVDLPGIVFLSPYVMGRPNEAAPQVVTFIGDINNDGFGDIAIGNPRADFIDLSFPQGPNAPGGDAAVGRRRDAGDAYIVYGNNFGSNRGTP
jgi:hypothetical protein